jgi:hypothetical protein
VEALNADREALWARFGMAEFLTRDEKRAAVGFEGGVVYHRGITKSCRRRFLLYRSANLLIRLHILLYNNYGIAFQDARLLKIPKLRLLYGSDLDRPGLRFSLWGDGC